MKRRYYLSIFLITSTIVGIYFIAPLAIIKIDIPLLPKFEGKSNFPPSSSSFYYSNKKDGTKLFAHYTPTKVDSIKGTIILVHGIRSNSNYFSQNISTITNEGYNVVCPDLRAHGKSEGTYCTYGYDEKEDISSLIDYLIENQPYIKLGIWGQSLGGAISLQTMAIDKRIEFGIIESTFSTLRPVTHDYCKRMAGINIPFITDFLLYRAGKIAKFPPNKIFPKTFCKDINQPIIFVHGNQDEHIHIKYNRENFNNIPHTNKTFLEIDGATHLNVWKSKEYFKKIFNLIDTHQI